MLNATLVHLEIRSTSDEDILAVDRAKSVLIIREADDSETIVTSPSCRSFILTCNDVVKAHVSQRDYHPCGSRKVEAYTNYDWNHSLQVNGENFERYEFTGLGQQMDIDLDCNLEIADFYYDMLDHFCQDRLDYFGVWQNEHVKVVKGPRTWYPPDIIENEAGKEAGLCGSHPSLISTGLLIDLGPRLGESSKDSSIIGVINCTILDMTGGTTSGFGEKSEGKPAAESAEDDMILPHGPAEFGTILSKDSTIMEEGTFKMNQQALGQRPGKKRIITNLPERKRIIMRLPEKEQIIINLSAMERKTKAKLQATGQLDFMLDFMIFSPNIECNMDTKFIDLVKEDFETHREIQNENLEELRLSEMYGEYDPAGATATDDLSGLHVNGEYDSAGATATDDLSDIVENSSKHFFISIGLSGSSGEYFSVDMDLSGPELIVRNIDGGITVLTIEDEVQSTSEIETKKGALQGDLLDTRIDAMPVSTELTEQSGEEPGRSQATAPAMAHSFSPPSFDEPFVTDFDLLTEFSDQELRDRKRLCYLIKRAIRRLESPDSVANFEELALEEPARMMQLRVPELNDEIGHIEEERQKRKELRQDILNKEIRTKHFTEDGTLTTAGLRHYEKTSVTLIESGCSPKDYVVVDCTASKHLVMDRQDFIHGELLLFSAYNEYVPPLQVANVIVNGQVKVNVVSTEVLKQHDIQLRVGPKDAFLCCRDYAYELLVIGNIYLLKIVHPMDMARRRSAKASPARLGSRRTRVVDIASTASHRTSHGTHARSR